MFGGCRSFMVSCLVFGACSLLGAGVASAHGHGHGTATVFVKGGAPPGGNGSLRHPLASLAAAEGGSRNGNTIAVLPSPVALDGGIALKPGQRLVGVGPHATITNSSVARYDGAAVVLSDDTTVAGLDIVDAYGAGIVGQNVQDVVIAGNTITGFDRGERIAATGWLGLVFPYAGIDLRASGTTRTDADIHDNVVANADGNGSIFRTTDAAVMRLHLRRNAFHDLRLASVQSPSGFVEAIFFDTTGTSRLQLDADHLDIDNIGTGKTANADALFSTLDGSSRQDVNLRHYRFRDTLQVGGPRASAGEYVTGIPTAGPQSRFSLSIADSDIRDAQAEGIQIDQFATGQHASIALRDTRIAHVGLSPTPDPSEHPFARADCVEITPRNPATANTIDLSLDHVALNGCTGNGVQIWNGPATLNANAFSDIGVMNLEIHDSSITNSGGAGVFVNNIGTIGQLTFNSKRSTYTGNQTGISLLDLTPGATGTSVLDLSGRNRIFGNRTFDIEANDAFAIDARHDWWGQPGGPAPGAVSLSGNATLDSNAPLRSDPGM